MTSHGKRFWLSAFAYCAVVAACNTGRISRRSGDSQGSESRGKAEVRSTLPPLVQVRAVRQAIVDLDFGEAKRLLDGLAGDDPQTVELRARVALSLGDCETATVLLSSATTSVSRDRELVRIAEGCAKAMAGAEPLLDDAHGVWVRVQNPRDNAMVPLIAEVVNKAATTIGKHLGTELPRPIRIELVSDLMSLSYLTGLPLEAAETTGTIAIARFGKVTMLSPRATRDGFPWQDTLAHELTHLLVSRRSGDEAPLWLQEGIAKREECRWRGPLPLDDREASHRQARAALRTGTSVDVTQLGASMALLPTPEMASIAYAEVQDLVDYIAAKCGDEALSLLLFDLRGLSGAKSDSALISVTGFSLAQWVRRWQRELADEPEKDVALSETMDESSAWVESSHDLRLGNLLSERRHWAAAVQMFSQLPVGTRGEPQPRYQLAHALSMLGRLPAARSALGEAHELRHLDGAWFSTYGRLAELSGWAPLSAEAFERSLAFAPTLERVACRGVSRSAFAANQALPALPVFEPWRSLCLDARSAPPTD